LGLVRAQAAWQDYRREHFDPTVWRQIASIPLPTDGRPRVDAPTPGQTGRPRACPLGIGVRGGTSRGPGSKSRLRLFVCQGTLTIRARVARNDFPAQCRLCKSSFRRADGGVLALNITAPAHRFPSRPTGFPLRFAMPLIANSTIMPCT
jgi:hypothetical protein